MRNMVRSLKINIPVNRKRGRGGRGKTKHSAPKLYCEPWFLYLRIFLIFTVDMGAVVVVVGVGVVVT